jgi:hypothetical protein
VWGVWGVVVVWGTFDIPQTALVATLDTYDFKIGRLLKLQKCTKLYGCC